MSFSIARVSRLLFGMAFLVVLSACGGSSSVPAVNNSGPGPAPGPAPGSTTPAQHLYVVNGTQTLQYPLPITSTSAPSVTLSVPAHAVAVDSNGNLAVADNAGNLLIYTAPISNFSRPSVTLATANLNRYVAFDPNGDLLAATLNQVNVYTKPLSSSSTISQVVMPPDGTDISGMAVDGSGNLYMSSEGNISTFTGEVKVSDISAFAPPWTSAPVIVQLQSPDITTGPIAVSTTQFFACDTAGDVSISMLPFPQGGSAGGLQPFHQCSAMAGDSSGNLYIAVNNAISIYAPPFSPSSVPIMTLNAPGNIAIGK
jgi:hypothetical protein